MDSKTSLKSNAESTQDLESKAKQTLTLLWNDLPAWLQDNHYIKTGYRSPSNSYQTSAASIGSLHNESVNIWTHLLGALLAAITSIALYSMARPRYQHATNEDVLVFSCFFIGAIGCLGMSATFHTVMNHSESVFKFSNRLDHIGIVLLIWGSFIPSLYYGFSADPRFIRFYWTMITTVGAATFVFVFYPKFQAPEWRPVRAAMFAAMGLSAVFPVLHGLQHYGYQQLEKQIGLSWLVTQGVLYLIGAAIYAARVPERWKPGSFDIWGNSHQIFHVLVLLAAAAHFVGLLKAFDYEHSSRQAMMSAYDKARIFGGP